MWYEVKIETASEAVEAVSYMLETIGAEGVLIEDPDDPVYHEGNASDWDYMDIEAVKKNMDFTGARVTCYLNTEDDKEETWTKKIETINKHFVSIRNSGLDYGKLSLSWKPFENKDWNAEWKRHYKPFSVGKNLVIQPSWEVYAPRSEDIVIQMDPGGAFGSGTHETTTLCMEVLEKNVKQDMTVFDIGCGSGILSVVAAKLGASRVVAVDIDKSAVQTAKENVRENGLSHCISVYEGDLVSVLKDKADIVVANIIASVIISMAPVVKNYIKPGGTFVAGGLLEEKVDTVIDALKANDFSKIEVHRRGEWAVVVAR